MRIPPLTIAVACGIAIGALITLGIRRWAAWSVPRFVDRALHPERYPSRPQACLPAEAAVIVRLCESEVICERGGGKVERVDWADLQKVEIVTTSDGPFAPDVFWVPHGTKGGCAVPQLAVGFPELLERLQTLPGFDNDAVVEAMSCTSDNRFLCWQRVVEVAMADRSVRNLRLSPSSTS